MNKRERQRERDSMMVPIRRLCSAKFLVLYGIIFLALFPFLRPGAYILHILIMCFIYGILSVSWDLLAGYAGQVSLGTAGFFAIGAYASALLSMSGVSPWLGLILGGFSAGTIGLVACLPSLRLRGVYFSIASLALAEIIRVVLVGWDAVTQGWQGLGMHGRSEYPSFSFPFIGMPKPVFMKEPYYYLALFMLLVSAFLLYKLVNTHIGLCFKAIREDELFARVLGINTTYYKVIAFLISSFLAGTAGSFFAHYITIITPRTAYMDLSVMIIIMTVIGGRGTIIGGVLGAIIIQILLESLLIFGAVYNYVFMGFLLMLFMLRMPRGIAGLLRR